ncbi:MAG: class I SAM-dependent methyltransferase [Candidatus Acidiferrales bacterium]
MNIVHRWLCSSARWRKVVEAYILPWTLENVDLGSDLIEIGPGPGISTDLLYRRVSRLTCVEIDRSYAEKLRRRLPGNVRVLCEDATMMSLADQSFDAAVCFTMLHHVRSVALQDSLMAEVARVLRPGGIFAGTDSLYSRSFRMLHLCDTMVVVDPATLPCRLRSAGFDDVRVEVMEPYAFRFRARKPTTGAHK